MRRLLVVVLMLLCSTVSARDGDERPALATKMIELIRPPVADCNPSPEALAKRVANAYRTRPGDFSGISPQSAYWPEVERIWREYYAAQCAESHADAATALLVKTYATQMSVQDLRDAIAFFGSPSGRAMYAANIRIANDFQAGTAQTAGHVPNKASTDYRAAMRLLKEKYEADPR